MFGCFFKHNFTKWSTIKQSPEGPCYQMRTCLRCNYKDVRIL